MAAHAIRRSTTPALQKDVGFIEYDEEYVRIDGTWKFRIDSMSNTMPHVQDWALASIGNQVV
jgi:hypothetical protein